MRPSSLGHFLCALKVEVPLAFALQELRKQTFIPLLPADQDIGCVLQTIPDEDLNLFLPLAGELPAWSVDQRERQVNMKIILANIY